MALPPIDVLLPVHDGLPELTEAVEDVLAQQTVTLRLIVVHDTHGADRDDGTGAWLADRARHDARLCVIPNEGTGLTDALVTGLDAADAPLVSHMEADDRCPPHRLQELAEALIGSEACGATPLAGVVSQVQAFGEVTPGMERYLRWQNSLISGESMHAERFVEIPALHQTGLYHREAIVAAGGYATAGPWPADIEFWFRWFEAGLPVAKLDRPLYRWRQHGRQSTRSGGDHSRAALRKARLHALARLHGTDGSDPKRLRLVATAATFKTWGVALREGPFELSEPVAWSPGVPPPERPEPGEVLVAVYGMQRARDALRAALPGLAEPDELLFAG